MAKPTPNPEPQRNRDRLAAQLEAINGLRRPAGATKPAPPPPEPEPPPAPAKQAASPANLGIWRDEATRREIEELTREAPASKSPKQPEPPMKDAAEELFEELERVKAENEELRIMLEETKAHATSAEESKEGAEGEQPWSEREKEYEYLLEEKSGVIRELHLRISELEGQGGGAPSAPPTANEQELLAMSDELERERCQLEQERRQMEEERRQLKEDEQGMMTQMREMEVLMAKERAELARQRNELQRLHSEIRHEIEVAQRDGLLNERLRTLQRKHQEVSSRKGGGPGPDAAEKDVGEAAPPKDPSKDSGMLRRLFRKK